MHDISQHVIHEKDASLCSTEKESIYITSIRKGIAEKNMSIPSISYEITDGEACTETYVISSESGYDLEYNFIFEYYDDIKLTPKDDW
jgi:hypothetical protein